MIGSEASSVITHRACNLSRAGQENNGSRKHTAHINHTHQQQLPRFKQQQYILILLIIGRHGCRLHYSSCYRSGGGGWVWDKLTLASYFKSDR